MVDDTSPAREPNPRPHRPDTAGERALKAIALYHIVSADEGFETAATMLFEVVRHAALTRPGKRRLLYLDIEGHRNDQGGYDHDMSELQQDFVIRLLLPYLSEAYLPLVAVKNPNPQRDDIPDELMIHPAK